MSTTPAATPFAVAKREKPKTVTLLLEDPTFKAEIAKALPKHMKPDRMLRVALTTVMRTPKLRECTIESFANAMLTCTQFGLEPDGYHAYLIPFENRPKNCVEAQLILGYKGIISLIRRSGDVRDIFADVVYRDDQYTLERGTNARIEHFPNVQSESRDAGNALFVYVVAVLRDGIKSFGYLTVPEINAVRDKSQGYRYALSKGKDHPWMSNWIEMAKKTVCRNWAKWAPLSPETVESITVDDERDEESRFANAKSAKVEAPNFAALSGQPMAALPAADPQPVPFTQDPADELDMSPPAPVPVPVPPHPVIGERKPRAAKAAATAPVADPQERNMALEAFRDIISGRGIQEPILVRVLQKGGHLEAGKTLQEATPEQIGDYMANMEEIVRLVKAELRGGAA